MKFLYLDDSGKIHPKDPAKFFVLAGFSVDESRWHPLVRQINGVKTQLFPDNGKPYDWEVKGTSYLTANAWKRGTRRHLCFEVVKILRKNACYVYGISIEKAKANDDLDETKFFPLAFQRLVAKFNAEVVKTGDTGTIVCDWSTYQMDHAICKSITGMVITNQLASLLGGVTYGSSAALAPLQVADLIAGTLRRHLEGQTHLSELARQFQDLRYVDDDQSDHLGRSVNSITKLF